MMPQGYAQPQVPFWQQPGAQQRPPAQQRPVPQAQRPAAVPQPRAQAALPPKAPVARGQMAEEPKPVVKPTPIALPSPEQLGIAVPAVVNWADLRVRLDRLGATGFALDRDAAGFRFTCTLPNGGVVEARAATEAEAVRQALAKVEGK